MSSVLAPAQRLVAAEPWPTTQARLMVRLDADEARHLRAARWAGGSKVGEHHAAAADDLLAVLVIVERAPSALTAWQGLAGLRGAEGLRSELQALVWSEDGLSQEQVRG